MILFLGTKMWMVNGVNGELDKNPIKSSKDYTLPHTRLELWVLPDSWYLYYNFSPLHRQIRAVYEYMTW